MAERCALLMQRVPRIGGRRLLGAMVLLEHIGEGGMGTVFRAWHLELASEVAVKVLHPQLAAEPVYVERFRREARLAMRISHRNVVRVFEVRHDHGLHYLVMEYVAGETLAQRVTRGGALQPDAATAVLLGLAGGLAEAHAQGIVHRDVKPENVLLASNGRVKLADLGIARHAVDELGRTLVDGTAVVLGTPQYMPPEQWDTPLVKPPSDVWAIGATFHFAAAGCHAVPPGAPGRVAHWVYENDLPTLRDVALSDARLHDVYERCVRRDALARYVDAVALREDLQRLGLAVDAVWCVPDAELQGVVADAPGAVERLRLKRSLGELRRAAAGRQALPPTVQRDLRPLLLVLALLAVLGWWRPLRQAGPLVVDSSPHAQPAPFGGQVPLASWGAVGALAGADAALLEPSRGGDRAVVAVALPRASVASTVVERRRTRLVRWLLQNVAVKPLPSLSAMPIVGVWLRREVPDDVQLGCAAHRPEVDGEPRLRPIAAHSLLVAQPGEVIVLRASDGLGVRAERHFRVVQIRLRLLPARETAVVDEGGVAVAAPVATGAASALDDSAGDSPDGAFADALDEAFAVAVRNGDHGLIEQAARELRAQRPGPAQDLLLALVLVSHGHDACGEAGCLVRGFVEAMARGGAAVATTRQRLAALGVIDLLAALGHPIEGVQQWLVGRYSFGDEALRGLAHAFPDRERLLQRRCALLRQIRDAEAVVDQLAGEWQQQHDELERSRSREQTVGSQVQQARWRRSADEAQGRRQEVAGVLAGMRQQLAGWREDLVMVEAAALRMRTFRLGR